MRRLIIFRHAKAAALAGGGDRERPLTARGRGDAALVGAYLREHGLIPGLALVSDARRTRETFEVAAPEIGVPVPLSLEPRIYEAGAAMLLRLVKATPADVDALLLIGHNPGLAELAHGLVGYGDRYALARMQAKFPTAALAVIDFSVEDWSRAALESGRLDRFITPALLGSEDD